MNIAGKKQAGYTLLELLYVVSIIALLAGMLIPQLLTQRARLIEVTAQRRLRTIGSVMADYSLARHGTEYADFQELKDADLISGDLTKSTIITDYSLVFITIDRSPGMGDPAGYTIIAYPKSDRSMDMLSTFAITEDNVVRIYRPGPGVSVTDPHTWSPIL